MSVVTWFRVVAVLAVALAVALAVQTFRANRADIRTIRLAADLQEQSMVAAGWARTAEATEAELAELVPGLRAELEAAHRVNASLLAAQHATGTVRLRVPAKHWPLASEESGTPPAASTAPGPGEPGHSPAGSPAPCAAQEVSIDADLQEAISGLADGRIDWTRRLQLRANGGEWADVPLAGAPSVDPRLHTAWAEYLRAGRDRWRWDLYLGAGYSTDSGGWRPAAGFGWGNRRFGILAMATGHSEAIAAVRVSW